MKKIFYVFVLIVALISVTACGNKDNSDDVKEIYVLLSLNMRLAPDDRMELYENYLDKVVQQKGYGYVTGGGTWLNDGEPTVSEVEFYIYKEKLNDFIKLMKGYENIGKGSYLEYNEEKVAIGTLDGLVLSINKKLDNESVNKLATEITELLKDKGSYYSYYQGEDYTNLYFYGNSYEEMKKQIEEYNKTCSVCENSTIEKINN